MEHFKTKESKIIIIFIFILFVIAMTIKSVDNCKTTNAKKITENILKQQNLICVNRDTGSTYKTNQDKYELLKVKKKYSDDKFEYRINFTKENKSFETVDCTEYKIIEQKLHSFFKK